MADVAFSCACGGLTGSIIDASPKTGSHAVCFCTSCRAGEVYSGAPDPAPDPIGVFQTSPHRINITSGQDQLAPFSFGPKNLLRWQAKCCGTAIFNTPRNPGLSFVAIRTTCLEETSTIGPVRSKGFIPTQDGKQRNEGLYALIFNAMCRMIGKRLSGRWKDTPFFDIETRRPIAPVTLVSKEERRALLP